MKTERIEMDRIRSAAGSLVEALLAERNREGTWTGHLSSSALSTATGAFALDTVLRENRMSRFGVPETRLEEPVARGRDWLAKHANADGGWGDTVRSHSNLSATTLAWVTLGCGEEACGRYRPVIEKAERWIASNIGEPTPDRLVRAITDSYGDDRTFSVPILSMCAIGKKLGPDETAWNRISRLPFELAVFPHSWYRFLGLPVVSYALPALIAIGQSQHHHRPTRNPITRAIRNLCTKPALRRLERIQPESGGFLEATPLTSFVLMNLASSGGVHSPVVRRSLGFLVRSARRDGSWPIDENLRTWVSTLAVNALSRHKIHGQPVLGKNEKEKLLEWLLGQQYRQVHPYTNADPGGWAWTDLSGGVPDADDTSGALLALGHLAGEETPDLLSAATAAIDWLIGLQNRDGGIPTFCRGWGKLPFDRSGVDLTAHAVRAFLCWRRKIPTSTTRRRIEKSLQKAISFLGKTQRKDGSWLPLWFGNQDAPGFENPTYGTSRVLLALHEIAEQRAGQVDQWRARAVRWFFDSQNPDGGWGGAPGVASSIEETALALESLSHPTVLDANEEYQEKWWKAVRYLLGEVEKGEWRKAAPIGFYFANLWYFEKLYPILFSLSALGAVETVLQAPDVEWTQLRNPREPH